MPIRTHAVEVVRIVEGVSGRVPMHMDLRIRFDYGSIVPWVRLFDEQNMLVALNSDPDQARTAWVGLQPEFFPDGRTLTCLYSTDAVQLGQGLEVVPRGPGNAVQLTVPAAGFVVYE